MPNDRTTRHEVIESHANTLAFRPDASVQLIVTSPPYPMIEMWDECFASLDARIRRSLARGDARDAFERMHATLDPVWTEVARVLAPGGLACVNIGDATRSVAGRFALYPNHARVLTKLTELGLDALPSILWRKPTNAPNKFMGSGMLPAGAYVTLEHEHILIVRKGEKREFTRDVEREARRRSALFWEERNQWFSDVWTDLRGARQRVGARRSKTSAGSKESLRERSGAFPFELAYRLVNMYSVQGDTVLDPFLGTGTTLLAAMVTGRNSLGYEIEPAFTEVLAERVESLVELAESRIRERLADHVQAMESRLERKGAAGHHNEPYGFPVVTRQETALFLDVPRRCTRHDRCHFEVDYRTEPDASERSLSEMASRPGGHSGVEEGQMPRYDHEM